MRTKLLLYLIFGLVGFAALPPCVAAGDRIVAGQYEITSTVNGKPKIYPLCITAAEAKGINGDAKTGREYAERVSSETAQRPCTSKDYRVSGSTVSYIMTCGDEVSTVRETYHGDSFEGDATVKFADNSPPPIVEHYTAKRVGACK
jgi:hypothetical protein